jgi:hypothetical protein
VGAAAEISGYYDHLAPTRLPCGLGSIRALDLWDTLMSAEGAPARAAPDTAADADQDTEIDTAEPDDTTGPEDDVATEDPDQNVIEDTEEPAN